MGLDKAVKEPILQEYQVHESDTGSAEVQVALLTKRIGGLTDHLRNHIHDEATRRGLFGLIGRRRRLLRYLNRKDASRYSSLIARLGLRRQS